ncbi:hypothetical protein B4Q13_22875, partial [Lacticaseibacillus rhamnosus]
FCAGADLSEFKELKDPQAAETRAELTMQLHLVFSKMTTPVVTAINGAAMGGGAGLAIGTAWGGLLSNFAAGILQPPFYYGGGDRDQEPHRQRYEHPGVRDRGRL